MDVVARAKYAIEHGNSDELHRELVAEIERLHSWDGLMSLVDEHYPDSVFPTMEDREDRDSGPRIISLIRQLDLLRAELRRARGWKFSR